MKKKIVITSIIVVVLLICIIGIFIFISPSKEDILKKYHSSVLVSKDTSIYDEDYKKVGTIEKGVLLFLEKKDTITKEDTYFKIENSNYYVYYKDVEKTDNISFIQPSDVWNENVVTNGSTTLYTMDNKKIVIPESINLPIYEKEENGYIVWYFNQLMRILKSDQVEVVTVDTSVVNTNHISVLYYKEIAENCSKTDCVSQKDLTKQLNYLKEQGYQSVSLEQYEKWLSGKILLKEKSILLLSDNTVENDDFRFELISGASVSFHETNLATTLSDGNPNMYKVTTAISWNQFLQMVQGEGVHVEVATSIPVINYHFFYDSRKGEGCNESICLDMPDFEAQIEYLLANDYKTVTIEEFAAWKYGEIELPKKSVLLTIDDGALGTGTHNGNKLIPTLEKYDVYATLFLISGWWGKENYVSPNLDVESHTHNMHIEGLCSNQARGAQMLCSTKQQVLDDLQQSIATLNTNTAFCFPFYAYNSTTIDAVKESGFKIAFIGGNVNATRSQDHYKVTRYPIYINTTLEQFKRMVSVY